MYPSPDFGVTHMRVTLASAVALLIAAVALSGCTGGGQAACSSVSGAFSCGGQVADKSATENHSWNNDGSKAMISWGGQAAGGSFMLTILDAAGKQVYSHSFTGSGQNGYTAETASGAPGSWTVRMTYTDFTGQIGLSVTGGSGTTYGCPPGSPYCR